MIVPVPPNEIQHVWHIVGPLLQKGIDKSNGEYTLDDLYQFLVSDAMQLLVAVINDRIVAAINTEIVIYPRKRAVRLINAGGSHLQQWGPELWEFMEQMAQNNNCDLIEAVGRPGWMRFLKSVSKDKGQAVKSTVVISRKV